MFRVVIVPIATTVVANKPYMYMYMYARWAENTPQKQRRIIIVNWRNNESLMTFWKSIVILYKMIHLMP